MPTYTLTRPPAQADHTIELNAEALSTGTLLPVTGTHHAHAEKTTGRIGEAFPEWGYDEFYVFSERPVPAPPTVMPAAELTPELDLVSGALASEGPGSEEVVSLAGGTSGLRISFSTNRA